MIPAPEMWGARHKAHFAFGLENDFVRLADELRWSIPQMSGFMLLVTLCIPPLGLLWAYWSMGGHMRPQASSWDE